MATDPAVLLSARDLDLHFGGTRSLIDVSIDVRENEILAIIGPNGAGKTSLLNALSGLYKPQTGEILYHGHNLIKMRPDQIARLGIGRTFQKNELFAGLATVNNLMAARQMYFKTNLLFSAFYFGPALKEEIENRIKVEEIIRFLKLEAVRDKPAGVLAYGLRKRVELGRALAMEPKILLLDEPTSGMNVEEREDMARFIIDTFELHRIPVVLVEHDMGVVMDIADRVVVLDFGRKIAEGTPVEIKSNPDVIKAYLGEESN
jgi:branched-chain amino acid transport system ATP-binding protein